MKDTTTSKETVGRSVIHECPNCFNDMYITYFRLLCEKCGFGAKIPYHILYDKFELDKSKELAIKNEIFRQLKSKYDFSKQTFTDSPNSRKHTTTIKGEVLEFIEGISNEYGLKSNDKALSFVISSFYILKKFIAGLNGRKVYLIDEQGNRSPNFIPAVFSKFEDIFFHSQDRESVRDLIECLEDGLSLEEQKKRMEGSKEEKGDE